MGEREREVPQGGSTYTHSTWHLAVSNSEAAQPTALTVEWLKVTEKWSEVMDKWSKVTDKWSEDA